MPEEDEHLNPGEGALPDQPDEPRRTPEGDSGALEAPPTASSADQGEIEPPSQDAVAKGAAPAEAEDEAAAFKIPPAGAGKKGELTEERKYSASVSRKEDNEAREARDAVMPSIHVDTAQMMFQVSSGGVPAAGYTYHPQYGPPPPLIPEVTEAEINRVWQVYVPPRGHEIAYGRFASHHLVVIQAPPGTGKRAAGIRFAADLAGSQGKACKIHLLDPETDLLDHRSKGLFEKEKIYLVDGLLASRAQKLSSDEWQALSEALIGLNSYIIICLHSETRLPSGLSTDLVYNLSIPSVSARELVKAHLRFLLQESSPPVSELQMDACLDDERMQALLEDDILPVNAWKLAEQVCRVLRGECLLEEALRGYSVYSEKLVQEWFEKSADLDEQAYRIALAVFSGARVAEFERAYQDLKRRLVPEKPEGEKDKQPPRSPFGRPLKSCMESAGAYIVTEQAYTEYSDHAEVRKVRLKDPSYTRTMLVYLWNEYPEFQDTLLSWLDDHIYRAVGDRLYEYPADIRHRAASAIGILGTVDFERIRRGVLIPWAMRSRSGSEEGRICRRALSTAVLVLVADQASEKYVRGLLDHWVREGQESLVWAAARAYAGVGVRYPEEAFEHWREILDEDRRLLFAYREKNLLVVGYPMLVSLVDAIVFLYTDAFGWPHFHEIYRRTLESLRKWVEADRKARRKDYFGLWLFDMLMSVPMPVEEDLPENEQRPPALLAMLDPKDPRQEDVEQIAWLLFQVVDEQETRPMALDLLRFWIEYVQEDDLLYSALKVILQTYLKIPDPFKRASGYLRKYLQNWANHRVKPLAKASMLLDDLGLES